MRLNKPSITCTFLGLASIALTTNAKVTCKPDECNVIDSYCRILHREPDSDGLEHYTEVLDDGGTVKELLQVLVDSDEFEDRFVTGEDEEDVVDSLYDVILGRDPDEEGAEVYKNLLEDGEDYRDIAAVLFDSDEYYDRFGNSKIPVGGRKNCGTRAGEDVDKDDEDEDDEDEDDEDEDDSSEDEEDSSEDDEDEDSSEDDEDDGDIDDEDEDNGEDEDGLKEGPIDPDLSVKAAEKLVKAAYCRALNREADEDGLETYTLYLLRTGNARDLMLKLISSGEYKMNFVEGENDEEIVKTLYDVMLAREPESEGLEHWTEEVKDAGYMNMVIETVVSDEYVEKFGDFKVPGDGREGCGDL